MTPRPALQADGRWRVRYTGADGKRKAVYSRISAADCAAQLDAALLQAGAGEVPIDGRLTVRTYLDRWVATWVEDGDHSARTVSNYRTIVERHLDPRIGRMKLGRLTASDVQAVLNAKAAEGVSGTYRQLIFDVLNAALKRAVLDGALRINPAATVKRPRRTTEAVAPWSHEETAAFLGAVEGDWLEALWNVALLCGLRRGEILGLRWTDIDFERGTIAVSGQLDRFTRKRTARKGGGRAVLVPMGERVASLLRARAIEQKRDQLRAGAAWTGNAQGLAFTTRRGAPLPANNVLTAWGIRIRRAGVRYTKLHAARHYFASAQYAGGLRDAEVGSLLGHSDRGETARRIYVHLSDAVPAAAVATINALHPAKRSAAQ